jgi:hypothetical protein
MGRLGEDKWYNRDGGVRQGEGRDLVSAECRKHFAEQRTQHNLHFVQGESYSLTHSTAAAEGKPFVGPIVPNRPLGLWGWNRFLLDEVRSYLENDLQLPAPVFVGEEPCPTPPHYAGPVPTVSSS